MALRILSEPDLPLILQWRNSPTVRMSMYSQHEISEVEHRAWFNRMQQNDTSLWYIHLNESAQADGVVYFTDFDKVNRSSFWGFYTNPTAPPGTGTALGIDAMNEAFTVKNLHKLNAEVLSSNIKSASFHRKLGFREEGTFREHHLINTSYIDVIRFGMLASEWPDKKSELERHIATFNDARKTEPGI